MKRMVVGLCLGLFIGLGAGAFASTGEKVEATFVEYIYEVDGEVYEVETPALLYHGTSHLPSREIANMLGYDVTYVAASKTIRFTTPAQPDVLDKSVVEEIRGATEVEIITPSRSIEEQLADVNSRLESAKASLEASLKLLPLVQDEHTQRVADRQIAETEQLIVDLEQQKADLEAQLQASP